MKTRDKILITVAMTLLFFGETIVNLIMGA